MLETEFKNLCESAVKNDGGVFSLSFEANRRELRFTAVRRVIKIEYVLRRSLLMQVKNVLFLRVYPNKNNGLFYYLPEIFSELGVDDFRAPFFSMIEDEARLAACFSALTELLNDRLGEIEEAADRGLLPTEREVVPDDSLERKLMFTSVRGYSREDYVLMSYTFAKPYKELLLGRADKAAALLMKQGERNELFDYQKRLLNRLMKGGGDERPMPDEANAVKAAEGMKKQRLALYFIAPLVLYALISALLLLVNFIFTKAFSAGCEAVFAAPWFFPLVLAAIPALFGTIALRRPLTRLLTPKNAALLNRFDAMLNGRGTNIAAYVFFGLTLAAAVSLVFVIGLAAVRIYPDRLDSPGKDVLFVREEYLYSDIDEVAHVRARYNVYGERVENGSYIIIMNDGRRLDLYGSADEAFTERKLLPLLEERGLTPKEYDSEKEIEK